MSTILIAFLLVAIIIIISFVLVLLNNKHRQRTAIKIVNLFNNVGRETGLSFSKKEIHENFIIGLDAVQKKILSLRKTGNKYNSLVIDLQQVKSCSKKKVYEQVNMGTIKNQKFETVLDKIVLEFDYPDKREPVQISFYEAGRDHLFEMDDLVRKAGSWEVLLTKTINNKLKSTV